MCVCYAGHSSQYIKTVSNSGIRRDRTKFEDCEMINFGITLYIKIVWIAEDALPMPKRYLRRCQKKDLRHPMQYIKTVRNAGFRSCREILLNSALLMGVADACVQVRGKCVQQAWLCNKHKCTAGVCSRLMRDKCACVQFNRSINDWCVCNKCTCVLDVWCVIDMCACAHVWQMRTSMRVGDRWKWATDVCAQQMCVCAQQMRVRRVCV